MSDWQTEARPVLERVYELAQDRSHAITSRTVAERLDADPGRVALVMAQLADSDYIEVEHRIDEVDGSVLTELTRIKPRALEEVAGWPKAGATSLDALLAAIDQRMAEAPEAERPRLAAFRDAAIDLGAKAVGEIAARAAGL